AVDVDAVPVGVDHQAVDAEVVHAGRQDAEVPAAEDGDVLDEDVAAQLQGDRLVAVQRGGLGAAAADQALAVDLPGAFDGDVLQALAPDQAVVPVAVAEVLERVAGA